ncbi:MAG: PIN domain-containing protein [Deltaproteobacteria bacterium]|nr:PIN domain-containing protein [Deltaproteobacteria bacterium]
MHGLIDTNILIYASSEAAPEHRAARAFLDQVAQDRSSYAITWINIGEYLAFVTQSFGGAPPLFSLQEACANVTSLLALPTLRLLTEGEGYWTTLQAILQDVGAVRGSFVHDCRIAAIMREHGIDTIFTRDTEFRRIPKLHVINPL